jgi:hypothetical protein
MTRTVRPYKKSDFEAVKAIHDATGINYIFPDPSQPLFLVTKVLEVDGVVRAALGAYIQVELYLWLDKSDWADPQGKFDAIKLLEHEVMVDAYFQGVDCAVLYLPPGMERFGERLVAKADDGGFEWEKPRDGWLAFSKQTNKAFHQEAGQ